MIPGRNSLKFNFKTNLYFFLNKDLTPICYTHSCIVYSYMTNAVCTVTTLTFNCVQVHSHRGEATNKNMNSSCTRAVPLLMWWKEKNTEKLPTVKFLLNTSFHFTLDIGAPHGTIKTILIFYNTVKSTRFSAKIKTKIIYSWTYFCFPFLNILMCSKILISQLCFFISNIICWLLSDSTVPRFGFLIFLIFTYLFFWFLHKVKLHCCGKL